MDVILPSLNSMKLKQKIDKLNNTSALQIYSNGSKDITLDLDINDNIHGVDKRVNFNLEAIDQTNKQLIEMASNFQTLDEYYKYNSEISLPKKLKSFEERNK